MEINKVSGLIIDLAMRIHREIGPGLLESVYEIVLADLLRENGLTVERQVAISIKLGDKVFQEGFRADLVVEGCIIVEIKSVRALEPLFKKQLLTYLKLSGLSVGLLLNFGGEFLKGNMERLVVGDVEKLGKEDSHGDHGAHGDFRK